MALQMSHGRRIRRFVNTDFTFIRQKIAEKREAIQKLDRERQRLADQIAAYEELLPDEPKETGSVNGLETFRQRGLSTQSRQFMTLLKTRNSFGFDEAVHDANSVGIQIDKKAMRTRLHHYVQSGYLARLSNGVFRLTKKGIENAAE
jgi:hypothetical protein